MLALKLRSHSIIPAIAAFALSGCGGSESGLADEGFRGEPFNILQGTLSAEDASGIDENISFALLWLNANADAFDPLSLPRLELPELTCTGQPTNVRSSFEGTFEGTGYFAHPGWIGQSVKLQASFPLRFEVPIDQLPPDNAIFDLAEDGSGTGEYAEAIFLVYVDTNGNGDFDAPSADSPADEVLAIADNIALVYLNGTIDPDPETGGVSQIPQGFSLFAWEIDEVNETIESSIQRPEDGVNVTIPASIADRKEAERRVCKSVVLRTEFGLPLPEDADPDNIICEEDGLFYTYLEPRKMVPDRTCVLTRPLARACLEPGAAAPANWPCR